MFAAAGDEADGAGCVLQVADEGSGDTFLRHALSFIFLGADLHDGGAEVPDAGFARSLRILVGVDVLDMDFAGKISVLIEQIFAVS